MCNDQKDSHRPKTSEPTTLPLCYDNRVIQETTPINPPTLELHVTHYTYSYKTRILCTYNHEAPRLCQWTPPPPRERRENQGREEGKSRQSLSICFSPLLCTTGFCRANISPRKTAGAAHTTRNELSMKKKAGAANRINARFYVQTSERGELDASPWWSIRSGSTGYGCVTTQVRNFLMGVRGRKIPLFSVEKIISSHTGNSRQAFNAQQSSARIFISLIRHCVLRPSKNHLLVFRSLTNAVFANDHTHRLNSSLRVSRTQRPPKTWPWRLLKKKGKTWPVCLFCAFPVIPCST